MEADNAEAILTAASEQISTISLGGIKDASNWDMMNFLLAEQTKQGANPDILSGRGAQAPTFGQEQMLYNNATRIVNNMYTRFQDFVISILKKLSWGFITDPTLEVPVVKEIPGYGDIPTIFSSRDVVENFYDFIFTVVPHSTQRQSPEMLYQKIMQLMTQWTMPTLQMAMAQGAVLDIPTLTKDLAQYAGIENFNQYYRTAVPQPGEVVPFQMQPTTNRKEGSMGQAGDAFGSTLGNRQSNLSQQQERTNNGSDEGQ
jgi:hypothetical protein